MLLIFNKFSFELIFELFDIDLSFLEKEVFDFFKLSLIIFVL